ncbi:hypothetical protein ABZP36_001642 [Zizania latifolia]
MMANKAGNTPLHEAVKHQWSTLALKMLEMEPISAHIPNKEMQSPMHIAAREGLDDVVVNILEYPWVPVHDEFSAASNGTALHQAVLGGHIKVVKILLAKIKRELTIDQKDSNGNTALHYAVQKNDARMVMTLLEHKEDLAYKCNIDRQSALHVAAYYGSTAAMVELLIHCPDVAEMLDKDGRNALHITVLNGKLDAFKCLLSHVQSVEVINRGDTPLHLAAKLSRIRSAIILLEDRRVDPCLLNRDGQSARTLVEERVVATGKMDANLLYLWEKLKKSEATRCKNKNLPPDVTYQSLRDRRAASSSGNDEYFQLGIETYTVVASLIATVTFAATFTMPGGYNQISGTAIHADRTAFKIFVLSNTVAMCSSVVVVFCFIWAWRDPLKFKLRPLTWGHRLTVVACHAMIISLMTSVYLTVLPSARWLAYLVIAIGACTPAAVVLILGKEVIYVPLSHYDRLQNLEEIYLCNLISC